MTLASVKPLGILSSLPMRIEGTPAKLSTLYNECTKLRNDKLNGRTPIQALLMNFKQAILRTFTDVMMMEQ